MSEEIDERAHSYVDHIKAYFGEKLELFGATPHGADWNSETSQYLRFEQVMKVCEPSREFSINDYGCGYGALIDFLMLKGYSFRYFGYDLLESMVLKAREIYKDHATCMFSSLETALPLADYTIASGIFNVRFQHTFEEWTANVIKILDRMDEISSKGFSFNMLTKYSDNDHMRPDLYYADPCFFFDYCKTHYAKNVALLHDYGLYDFTILVRKQI